MCFLTDSQWQNESQNEAIYNIFCRCIFTVNMRPWGGHCIVRCIQALLLSLLPLPSTPPSPSTPSTPSPSPASSSFYSCLLLLLLQQTFYCLIGCCTLHRLQSSTHVSNLAAHSTFDCNQLTAGPIICQTTFFSWLCSQKAKLSDSRRSGEWQVASFNIDQID